MRRRTIFGVLGAALVGFCLASFLLWLSYATHSEVLFWPQAGGFFLCWLTRGIHNATETDYWTITVPVNAALYTGVILVVIRLLRRKLRHEGS